MFVVVYKIDRFGRSVLHLNQQLAALTSYGVRFIATSQSLDTDERNPTSRLLLQILASVAEFEREIIRERTLSGIKAAQAVGKVVGRPKRVFRRDEVVRLRDKEGLSWRAIGEQLGIPAMTALDSYRNGCTENGPARPTRFRRQTQEENCCRVAVRNYSIFVHSESCGAGSDCRTRIG
jgi:DNA invertase Pin-like site-specific DNA recombinase